MFALVEYKSAVTIDPLWLSKFHKESNTQGGDEKQCEGMHFK